MYSCSDLFVNTKKKKKKKKKKKEEAIFVLRFGVAPNDSGNGNKELCRSYMHLIQRGVYKNIRG